MGVTGLWDILRPAATTRSLTDLAIKEGFQANPDGRRGFRLGIDASIWFFHAEYGKEGENPVLRTLFFRCATLMRTTFLPIFVFDGPKRPDIKRGKKINKTSNKLIPGMKQIVEAFGFEWRTAPGEAEAELAYLNRLGIIDGILSDDVDNFLFGATVVIRNSSNTLSGNRVNPVLNAAGKDDKNHTRVFRLEDISTHPKIRLTRGGMILIGLMSGGDYQQGGIMRCGTTTAHGLAKCGFGDTLYTAATNLSRVELADFLVTWRHDLRHELRTNSRGEIGRKQPSLSKAIPEDFPDIDILFSYVRPITSESMGRENNNLKLTWSKEPDLGKLAALCEFYFEWGYKESIIKRFRTVMWHSMTLRILRRSVLNLDEHTKPSIPTLLGTPTKNGSKDIPAPGTPSKSIARHFSSLNIATPRKPDLFDSDSENQADTQERLVLKIHGSRTHVSTDGILEYRLEIAPKQLVRMAEAGIKGTRVPEGPDEWASEEGEDEDTGTGKSGKIIPIDPETHLRLWMPACMVALVEPRLVEEYENIQAQRGMKKSKCARADTQTTKTTLSRPDRERDAGVKSRAGIKDLTKDRVSKFHVATTHNLKAFSPAIIPLSLKEPANIKSTAKTDGLSSVFVRDAERITSEGTSRKTDITTAQCKILPRAKAVKNLHAPADSSEEQYYLERLDKTSGTTQILMSPSKRRARSIVVASCSDSYSQHLKKSPRKIVKTSSVGKQRPASPTPPCVSRSTQIKTYDEVIEVSSDSSDGSLPSRIAVNTLPPLTTARARVATKSIQDTTLSRHLKPKKAVGNSLAHLHSEIIDLTSSS